MTNIVKANVEATYMFQHQKKENGERPSDENKKTRLKNHHSNSVRVHIERTYRAPDQLPVGGIEITGSKTQPYTSDLL